MAAAAVCKAPADAREPVAMPPLPDGPPTTIADVLIFSVRQEEAVQLAERRRAAAIKAIDDCNAANAALARELR